MPSQRPSRHFPIRFQAPTVAPELGAIFGNDCRRSVLSIGLFLGQVGYDDCARSARPSGFGIPISMAKGMISKA
jgi:hypothetical protein